MILLSVIELPRCYNSSHITWTHPHNTPFHTPTHDYTCVTNLLMCLTVTSYFDGMEATKVVTSHIIQGSPTTKLLDMGTHHTSQPINTCPTTQHSHTQLLDNMSIRAKNQTLWGCHHRTGAAWTPHIKHTCFCWYSSCFCWYSSCFRCLTLCQCRELASRTCWDNHWKFSVIFLAPDFGTILFVSSWIQKSFE